MIDREELAQHLHEAAWPGETAWLHQSSGTRLRFLRAADRALALIGQSEPAPAPKPKIVQVVDHDDLLYALYDDGSLRRLEYRSLTDAPDSPRSLHWIACDWPEASE